MKENKRSIWSWALYDWANSAYATTVMAGFFPIFFKEYWADPNIPSQSTFYLGMANSLYAIVVAALAPFLGAIADQGSKKKKFLIFFAFLGSIMTGGLWIVNQGHWQMAVFVYVLAAVGFAGGNIFYRTTERAVQELSLGRMLPHSEFSHMSNSAFGEDWNSNEDQAYDRL